MTPKAILYTCNLRKNGASWHPCGLAAKALDDAGLEYEIRTVRGYASMPWTWLTRGRDRAAIRELSGQNAVPVLLLADGTVVAGSKRIKRWADSNRASSRSGREAIGAAT